MEGRGSSARVPWIRAQFRVLGFRVWEFRVLGFKGLGSLGFRV